MKLLAGEKKKGKLYVEELSCCIISCLVEKFCNMKSGRRGHEAEKCLVV